MIEAHYKMSIQRVKAGAGVALEKGLGAEGRKKRAQPSLALRKISVVLSQQCGELSTSRQCAVANGFYGQGYALLRTSAF
jgi:hypothetical protein